MLIDGRFAVLADRSTSGSVGAVGDAVVRCHDDFNADDVVVEVNFGGDMGTEVVKQAAERAHQQGRRETSLIRIKEVSASRGKVMRPSQSRCSTKRVASYIVAASTNWKAR